MSCQAHFVITHKPIEWRLPFSHTVIGVEKYVPEVGFAAGDFIGEKLAGETSLGTLRAIPAILKNVEGLPSSAQIFHSHYRLFLSSAIRTRWASRLGRPKVITPSELLRSPKIILTAIPTGLDIISPAPMTFKTTVVEQYHESHILEDLMFGLGVALRAGLISGNVVSRHLNSKQMIPFGNFAAHKSVKTEFLERLWWCALEFLKSMYVPRSDYQKRVVDFVFERITSFALAEMIESGRYNVGYSRVVRVSADGIYRRTE
jgi:hypothetical protein